MYISELPQSLIELAKVQLEKNKSTVEESSKGSAKEEIVINPVIDSPHTVQTR